MLMIIVLVRLSLRVAGPWSAIATALAVALLAEPRAVLLPGFWLSFIAVAWLLLFGHRQPLFGGQKQSRWETVRGFFLSQFAVIIGMAVPALSLFGGVSLLAPLSNVIAIPAFTLVIVPAALSGVLLLYVDQSPPTTLPIVS